MFLKVDLRLLQFIPSTTGALAQLVLEQHLEWWGSLVRSHRAYQI